MTIYTGWKPSILLPSLLFFVFTCSGASVLFGQEEEMPNVIVILTDDQGTLDLNCYGATDLRTPNLDQLAATGTRFTNFYVGAPICSPSRAALLTGRTPQGAGLARNASSIRMEGMPASSVTIAEMMKGAGYVTAHIGKWHLGYTPETMPNGQGFDYSFGIMEGCIDNFGHFYYWNGPNRHDLWENGTEIFRDGEYFPDMITDKAISFIKTNKRRPFFMYYALNTPHYPLQPTVKWREYYQALPMPRRDYAAFVSTTDEKIGDLIHALEKEGLRKKTIIIYLSDHGYSSEERAFGGGGFAGPYKGSKGSLFEGGIKVPAIISWKGHLPENKVVEEVCMSMDLLPTIAKLCGITPIPAAVEGSDISAIIKQGGTSPHDIMHWQLYQQWAVRKGDWKLIANPVDNNDPQSIDAEKDKFYLVNLRSDISEATNLAQEFPEKVKELIEAYRRWQYAKEQDIPKM